MCVRSECCNLNILSLYKTKGIMVHEENEKTMVFL